MRQKGSHMLNHRQTYPASLTIVVPSPPCYCTFECACAVIREIPRRVTLRSHDQNFYKISLPLFLCHFHGNVRRTSPFEKLSAFVGSISYTPQRQNERSNSISMWGRPHMHFQPHMHLIDLRNTPQRSSPKNGRTDRRKERRTDRRTDASKPIVPNRSTGRGLINHYNKLQL